MGTTREFLEDLFSRRDTSKLGDNGFLYLQLVGGKIIEPTAFEPDANTHRSQYYYNAVTNTLYRKITVNGVSHWQGISE